jgi:DNA-binding NarL/FixJ family response regulator
MSNRALIVDDHPIVRDALMTSLLALAVFDEIDVVGSFRGLIEQLETKVPYQLLILDLSLTDTSGPWSVEFVREHYMDVRILVFSASDSADVITQCFEKGVHGFVSKHSSMQVFVNAIRLVLAGGIYIPPAAARALGFESQEEASDQPALGQERPLFTPKQQEVFDQLVLGLPNKVIASRLQMAEGTVKTHLHGIYQILRVNSRAQAILKSRQFQIINGMSL